MNRRARICVRLVSLAVFLPLVFCVGCSVKEQAEREPAAERIPPPISVVFVDFPGVAEKVARQWSAQRNSTVTAIEISTAELFANNYDAICGNDIIVYPGNLMGSLVADDVIAVLPNEVWESTEFENRSLLRHGRTTLARFGRERWAVPIANPQFLMMARNDVLAALKQPLPQSWSELFELQDRLKNLEAADQGKNQLPTAVVLPLAEGWAAKSFLMIAASSIRHRGLLNSLFDRHTMQPLLESEPFVVALEELKRLAGDSIGLDPAGVTRKLFSGQAAIAFGWPGKTHFSDELADSVSDLYDKIGIAQVPGSERWFDFQELTWRDVDNGIDRVELVGFASRQASILKSASHPTDAFNFLAWLGSKQVCSSIFSEGKLASPTRTSHLGNTGNWAGDVLNQHTADQFADLVLAINDEPVFMVFPRIRGSHRYWDSLESSVQRFLAGQCQAEQALSDAARDWNKITDEYGREKQIELLRQDQGF